MKKKSQKPKPVYHACNVKFPERVWEPGENGWSSREATAEDWEARKAVATSLSAEILA